MLDVGQKRCQGEIAVTEKYAVMEKYPSTLRELADLPSMDNDALDTAVASLQYEEFLWMMGREHHQ
jgi:hypothetical protein